MSLRGKLTEEAPTERQFDEVSELDKELERTEILREQLIRKKELALRKEKHLDQDNIYTVEPDMKDQIDLVIKEIDHYNDMDEFIKETINNATDFWLHPENMMSLGGRMWTHFTNDMKNKIKFLYPAAYYLMENGSIPRNKLATMCKNLKDVKDGLSKKEFSAIPKNIVEGDAYSLMHQSYNRFFPLKILVTTLASMINAKKEQGENEYRWIDYEEFSKAAYDIALELSNKLKHVKDPVTGKNPRREVRISTGLPILHMVGEHDILDQKETQKVFEEKLGKDEKSKERFLVCFVGPKPSSFMRVLDKAECVKKGCKEKFDAHYESSHDFSGHSKFAGALNETGLVYVRKNKHRKLEITLSKIGYDFFNYDNPFLDNIDVKDLVVGEIEFHKNDDGLIDKKVFSDDEMNFITKEIIPRFDLEEKIVDSVIKWMKNKSEVDGIQLDTPIEKTVSDWVKKNKPTAEEEGIGLRELIGSYRHATMSRLAEIGKVTWIMKPKKLKDGTKGFPESFYSINK
jgi:hypothetical protein